LARYPRNSHGKPARHALNVLATILLNRAPKAGHSTLLRILSKLGATSLIVLAISALAMPAAAFARADTVTRHGCPRCATPLRIPAAALAPATEPQAANTTCAFVAMVQTPLSGTRLALRPRPGAYDVVLSSGLARRPDAQGKIAKTRPRSPSTLRV
jgi:hypothetical protein